MTPVDPIATLGMGGVSSVGGVTPGFAEPLAQPRNSSFSDMLMDGLRATDTKLDKANQLVRQFAVDDSIPVHQVTIALEQARMSVELAMQVRTRLIEGYRELMNMQL